MTVAIINDFPPYTGLGNYAFSVFDEFKKRRRPVEMLYLENKNRLEKYGEDIKPIRTPYALPFLSKSFNSYFYFPKHLPDGYELYHAANQFIARCAACNKPSIVTCLDIIPIVRKRDYPISVWLLLELAMKQIRSAGRVIAISEHTKRDLMLHIGIPEGRIEVIPLGFNPEIFRPMDKKKARRLLGLDEDAVIVLNVGSGEKRKNIPTLLKAFAIFKKEFPDAMLVRIGEETQENIRLARESGIIGDMAFFHIKDKKRLALFYNSADLFVFPSLYEGFGMPPVEALACDVPTVVADATSLPEAVGNAAALVKPLDSEAYAGAMAEIMNSHSYRKSLIAKGRKQARKFEWEKIADATWKVYEEALR